MNKDSASDNKEMHKINRNHESHPLTFYLPTAQLSPAEAYLLVCSPY